MTPETHIAAAETALARATDFAVQGFTESAKAWAAIAHVHAMVAHAVEGGVRHGAVGPVVEGS